MEYNDNALALYNLLKDDNIIGSVGKITFKLANTSVDISTTDTVGQSLQSWLKQYMLDKKIIFIEMDNTQEFPDFILDPLDREKNLLYQSCIRSKILGWTGVKKEIRLRAGSA